MLLKYDVHYVILLLEIFPKKYFVKHAINHHIKIVNPKTTVKTELIAALL